MLAQGAHVYETTKYNSKDTSTQTKAKRLLTSIVFQCLAYLFYETGMVKNNKHKQNQWPKTDQANFCETSDKIKKKKKK